MYIYIFSFVGSMNCFLSLFIMYLRQINRLNLQNGGPQTLDSVSGL